MENNPEDFFSKHLILIETVHYFLLLVFYIDIKLHPK